MVAAHPSIISNISISFEYQLPLNKCLEALPYIKREFSGKWRDDPHMLFSYVSLLSSAEFFERGGQLFAGIIGQGRFAETSKAGRSAFCFTKRRQDLH